MQTGAAALMDELVTPVAVDLRDLQSSATTKLARTLLNAQLDENESEIRRKLRIWSDRPGI